MKSEVFNGQRFWTYFKYDFKQMGRNHVKAAIGFGLAGLILYFLVVLFKLIFTGEWMGPSFNTRVGVFVIMCMAVPFYYTRIYGYLTDKRKGSAYFMLPASTFEKWLSMMLLSLVLLPLLFLASSFLVDWLLCVIDPTMSDSILGSITDKTGMLRAELATLNETYETSWSIGTIGWPFLVSFLGNLLYFLLCGICFRRNKILGAIAVSIGITMLLSFVLSLFGETASFQADSMDDCFASKLKSLILWSGAISALIAAGLSAGIFYRLKTIKH